MRRLHSTFLLLLALGCAGAAEAPPDLPDPFGLGPRLVLLDHLRTQYGLKPPEDATYEQLVALYWSVKKPAAEPAKLDDATMVEDEALVRDRVNRLRAALKQEFTFDAPADATEGDLAAELRRRRGQRQQQAIDETAERSARERAVPAAAGAGEAEAGKPPTDPADPSAAWRARVRETWQTLDAIPTEVDTTWAPVDAPMANLANECRIRRNGGDFAYPERPPPMEPGLEVWLQNTKIEAAHVGGYQTSRWWPATWIAEERQWTIEHPARHRWARESQHYSLLVRLLVAGPRYDQERQKAWAERRKALASSNEDPAGDAVFVRTCAAAAKEGGFADLLPRVEGISLRVEAAFKQLDEDLKQYQYADDLARANSGDAPKLAEWQARLEERSRALVQLHIERRAALKTIVSTIAK